MPRETREQRAARKQAQAEMRARQQAAELARALERRQDFDSLHTIHGRSCEFSNNPCCGGKYFAVPAPLQKG